MSLWSWFFNNDTPTTTAPSIRFGRYSDSYKQAVNYEAWEKSLQAYEANNFLLCCRYFFTYLRDEAESNVFWHETDEKIEGTIIQGSQKITVEVTAQYLRAASHIAKAEGLNVGMMRKLLEHNETLQYGHFALSPQNELTAIFTTHAIDGSPYKLYYGLKEIATISDKEDNLLLDEFKNLSIVYEELRKPMSVVEKEAKYQFTTESIMKCFATLDESGLNLEQHPKAVSYVLFDTLFRLDYFTSPEGHVMEIIERAFRKYYENDNKNIIQKNNQLRKELNEILNYPKSEHLREYYKVNTTFGITVSITHQRVKEVINEHIGHAEWYEKNNLTEIAQSIYDYIVGFLFFSYAMPKNIRLALDLYFEVREIYYVESLGIKSALLNKNGDVQKVEIEKRLNGIFTQFKEKYPRAKFNTAQIDYTSVNTFSKTFLQLLYELDMTVS